MGGNLFKDLCKPITLEDAQKIVPEIIEKIKEKFPEKIILPIGSCGLKEISSDIDIAIKTDTIKELKDIIEKVFDQSTYIMESLYIVSIPYKYGNDKYVSVDFIQMKDIRYTYFRYKSPNYLKGGSKYKVGTKIMMVGDLLRLSPIFQQNMPENCYAWMDYSPIGLYRNIYNEKEGTYVKQFITTDPEFIMNCIFKENGDYSDFYSVETLWKAIHEKPLIGGEEMLKNFELSFFVNCYRKCWEEQVNPKDFNIKYWTLEELYKEMEKQIPVRKANEFIDKMLNENPKH